MLNQREERKKKELKERHQNSGLWRPVFITTILIPTFHLDCLLKKDEEKEYRWDKKQRVIR